MSYDLSIIDHARTMFGESFRQACEQTQSRLRNRVTVSPGLTGTTLTRDMDSPAAAGENVTGQRFKQVNVKEIDSAIRYLYPERYQEASFEERWDANTIAPLVSPAGRHSRRHQIAFNKFVDSLVLSQLLGNASEAASGTTTPSTIALPATQKIAKDYVFSGSATDSGLTVDKLLFALEKLAEAEVYGPDQEEMGITLHIATNAKVNTTLLREVNSGIGAKLLSKDYMPPTIDEKGYITKFLGINFVRTELISTVTSDDDKVALCPLWASDCFELGFWEDIELTIDRRPDLSNALQFLSQASIGAGRLKDEGVIQIAARTGAA